MKKKIFSLLVLLMTAVSGAWAQEETLLTTITPTGDGTYSETTAGAVTVTPAGSFFYSGSSYGWRWDSYGSLTVTANEGYTITRCVFIQQGKNQSVTISEAPFELNFEEFVCLENTSMDGVTSIEVYGTAPAGPAEETVTLNHSANNTWAIAEMPDGDVELEVEYFDITVPTANTADIYAGSTTPLINAGSTTEDGATMKYLVTATNEQPASTDGFSADVPTAEAITAQGTYYVWYYLDLDSGDDSDISALAVEVTVSAPTYDVTMKEGTLDADNWEINPANAASGTEITLKYNGKKKVKNITIEAAPTAPAAKAAAEATAEDKGKLIGTDGNIYADVEAATAAGTTAVAKIIYIGTTGHATYNHGLALALTDEASKMAWQDAIDACSAKNTSIPVTGATWLLASQAQWDYMLGTDGAGSHYDLRSASNLQWNYYYSSTEDDSDSSYAWYYSFAYGIWLHVKKGNNNYVRACLAF